jgi:hypothetical protein
MITDSFGPKYLQQWQERIQALKRAEEALVKVRSEVSAELADCALEQCKGDREEILLDEKLKASDRVCIGEQDCRRIER